jgi:uncharacterized protein
MRFQGAGGTSGGVGTFIIGFLMMCTGFYMLLQSIVVTQTFGLGMGLYGFTMFGTHVGVTSGMILVPMMFGIGMIFYNARNYFGWGLALGSLAALIVGVIANIHFVFRTMTLFDLLVILVLTLGGVGLFLRSLKHHPEPKAAQGDAAPEE